MAAVAKHLESLQETLGLRVRRVLGMGAEALLVEGELSGMRVVAKFRVPKEYRDPTLDARLRKQRTALEAKLLCSAAEVGVNVPDVIYVDPDAGVLILSYVEGTRVKELIEARGESAAWAIRVAGLMAGVLHEAGIVHGDLTTSNMICAGRKVYFIDFGLGFFSNRVEDAGVDVHLFRRALESTHPSLAAKLYSEFAEGYSEARGKASAESVLRKVEEIRLRGRYVSQRRLRAFWQG